MWRRKAEQTRGVRYNSRSKSGGVDATKIREKFECPLHKCGLVAFAAIRLRREIRRVSLDHHAVVGDDCRGIANRRGILEGNDPRE